MYTHTPYTQYMLFLLLDLNGATEWHCFTKVSNLGSPPPSQPFPTVHAIYGHFYHIGIVTYYAGVS